MPSTADRWFVPDQLYKKLISDYALVAMSTSAVREQILFTNKSPRHISDAMDTFMSEYNRVYGEPCYEFDVDGRLVYADVDDEDPAHKERIYKWAKEIPIEQESEKTIAAKKKVLDAWIEGIYVTEDIDGKEFSREGLKQGAQQDLKLFISRGVLYPLLISEILQAKSLESKEEILDVMSDQIGRPTKRPVMLLIKMIDSKQTTKVGETKGWAVGYDFIKELLVIKPFYSREISHPLCFHREISHPLGGKWHGEVAQDGVSFSGTLQEFAKAYIELGKTVDAASPVDAGSGFKLLVHTVAAQWIHRFRLDLGPVYGSDFRDDLLALRDATVKIKNAMDKIALPLAGKNEENRSDAGQAFESILRVVQSQETDLRQLALAAREQGKEKIARNIAGIYGHVEEMFKYFHDDPCKDFDL
ncbi:hypothetical protein MMC07_007281 [Pseudocyphellaria aurata]|nr:hypothetical protein [Pseudocyphellaria aurata]